MEQKTPGFQRSVTVGKASESDEKVLSLIYIMRGTPSSKDEKMMLQL
jgi:hypothetical protein